ncbi:MAG TPA: glycosyltransferase family 9 protein [Candidatus Methylomirabilis sp.]|nr:glycosyltransferase family 9 protein [Candidatus Methylomirabilis sp.]
MSWIARPLEYILEVGLHRRWPKGGLSFRADHVRRILVVRKDNIGDVLCTTPALRALRRAFPAASLAILVAEHCHAAVERNPDVDEVLTYTKAKHRAGSFGLAALWDLARVIQDLRARTFDLAVAMGRPCSRSSAWLAYASGARWRLGYSTPALQPFPFFINLGRDPGPMDSHEVDGCLDLLASIGIPSAGRRLTLTPSPDAVVAIRQSLSKVDAEPGGIALIHISNRREASRWPLAAFAETADRLHNQLGLSIVLSWAPGDSKNPFFPGDDGRAEEIAQHMQTRPTLLRTPDLDELMAGVSVCDFVLSTDGGLMHIAAALDIPQVVLFGKTSILQWAPVSEKCTILCRGGRVDEIPVEEVVTASVAVVSRWGQRRLACLASPSAATKQS